MALSYREIDSNQTAIFKEKNSKFIGYSFVVKNETEVEHHLALLRKEHHNARHFCFAYRLGELAENTRYSDDGEPNGSAGLPIYQQLLSFDITNVLVVVVRYFGGVKLGVGGLRVAYKEGAKLCLEESKILTKHIYQKLSLKLPVALGHHYYQSLGKFTTQPVSEEVNGVSMEVVLEVALADLEGFEASLQKASHQIEIERLV